MHIRRAGDRGHFDHGWLDTRHTFSFADYYDAEQMGFRGLRVINEDRVQPGRGFGTHPHRDMEIVSWVLEGGLAHRDSMGSHGEIRPGDVQRMTAGGGVLHSEMNASTTEPVHFLQIWLLPSAQGLEPSYEQRRFDEASKRGQLRLVASDDGRDGSVTIHADARLFATRLEAGERVTHMPSPGRHVWVQVARGRVLVNGQALEAGDGAALSEVPSVTLEGVEGAEALLFDLA